jgi:hypothetical protein
MTPQMQEKPASTSQIIRTLLAIIAYIIATEQSLLAFVDFVDLKKLDYEIHCVVLAS